MRVTLRPYNRNKLRARFELNLKEVSSMKKFAIRKVETVKTTAAMYECRACYPEWFCDLIGAN